MYEYIVLCTMYIVQKGSPELELLTRLDSNLEWNLELSLSLCAKNLGTPPPPKAGQTDVAGLHGIHVRVHSSPSSYSYDVHRYIVLVHSTMYVYIVELALLVHRTLYIHRSSTRT